MESVVVELQQDALDKSVPISDLLRKAYVVARKLNISELEHWINLELNGYSETEECPEYRQVKGQVKAWNPYHGWKPVMFSTTKMEEALSTRACGQSIAELESLISDSSDNGSFQMPFSAKVKQQLRKVINFDTEITLFTEKTGIVRTLDAVRTIILNWALKLEENGVFGNGLIFNKEEINEVEKHSYNINNFYGPVHGSQIQQGNIDSEQKIDNTFDLVELADFLNTIKSKVKDLRLEGTSEEELIAEIETIESQSRSPKPKVKVIEECLESIQRILEGASGGVAAQLLIQIAQFFTGGS